MKLNFKYSIELETKRVLDTISRLDWFSKNHYKTEFLIFPKGVSIDDPKNKIVKKIKEEFDIDKYTEAEKSLMRLFYLYELKFISFIEKFGLTPIPNIDIILTKYGIGGSYNLPNIITVNFSIFFNIGLLRTVLHEIIHLHIQHLIDKFKIEQWQKEVIVDNLFEKFSSNISKKQKYPMDMSKIEKIFNEYYPNLELIMDNISKKLNQKTG